MRTKSFWVRSSRKSLDPSPSPALIPDESNERFGSRASTKHCDSQFDSGDADVEIVPDTFDEIDVPDKKRHCLGTSETSRRRSEPLNLDACIVCEISDKCVSRCSGIGCILSFHGECLNAEFGGIEDLLNPYCPYCWFQIVSLKYKSAREKAIEAEKAVYKYLGKEKINKDTTDSGDENVNQEHSEDSTYIVSDQELEREKDTYSSKVEQVQVEKDSDKSSGEKMPSVEETTGTDKSGDLKENNMIEKVEASEYEERISTENFQDAKDYETTNNQTNVNTDARKNGDISPFLSMQESFSCKEQRKEKQRRRRIVIDSEISSNESTNERNGEDVTEQITSSAQVTSPSGKTKNQQRKHNTTTKADKSKTVRDISFFKKDQRRRLYWTSEEEEMLKVGVEKFAVEANKNMPWRKILEMGDKVFNETRTPADLKDKWRNMIGGRLEQKTNKTVH